MCIHNIPFPIKKRNHPKLSQIYSYVIFSKGLKNEFETVVVNEPLVFEPLKFYCILVPKKGCGPIHIMAAYKKSICRKRFSLNGLFDYILSCKINSTHTIHALYK